MEGEVDLFEQKKAQGNQSIKSTEGKVPEPSRISTGLALTLSEPVDQEKCSMCASVLEELKKTKTRERYMKKKLSAKKGTITKLRNMLEEADNNLKIMTSRVLSAESALRASEVMVQEAETKLTEAKAKLAEADARARSTRMQLLDIDVRAAKSEVKACKCEVKLKEAERWAWKAKAELAKAEQQAKEFEEKLMEALKRACVSEATVTEMEAKMKESQRAGAVRVQCGGAMLSRTVAMGRMETTESRIKEELVEARLVKQPLQKL